MKRTLIVWILATMAFGTVVSAQEPKPWFSLATYRTYGPDETAQVHVMHQDIDALDFRVYKVRDPIRFFEQLEELHAFGPSSRPRRPPSRIETVHKVKQNTFTKIREYFRAQLSHNTRKTVLHAFSGKDSKRKEPARGAKFAPVPLLNESQLVQSWHEPLTQKNPNDYYRPQAINVDVHDKGVYLIEAVNGERRAYTVLIITSLALVSKSGAGQLLILAVDRASGRPIPNGDMKIYNERKPLSAGRTDTSGIFQVNSETIKNTLAVCRLGEDFAVSDLQHYYFEDSEKAKAYIYTDRPVYRPGHKVYFKGILRDLSGGEYTTRLPDSIEVEVHDAEGKPVYKEDLKISDYGTFDGELVTTEAASLGYYSILARLGSQELRGGFSVEEYKKPEYEVKVTAPKKVYIQGEPITAEISARYYFGEPVVNATVQYQVFKSRYYNWGAMGGEDGDYYGGEEESESGDEDYVPYDNVQVMEEEGTLDANGKLSVRIPTDSEDANNDFTYRINARVTDAARREISSSTRVIVMRGEFSIGISTDRYLYRLQDTANIGLRTTTFEGKPVSAPVDVEILRRTWANKQWQEQSLNRGSVTTDSKGQAVFSHPIRDQGYFIIRAKARDGAGHKIASEHYFYVGGEGFDDYYGQDSRRIELIPDKKAYRVGETAHLLVLFPVKDVHALTTLEGRQIHNYNLKRVAGRSFTLDIPIRREYAMDGFVNVAFVKAGQLYTRSKLLKVMMEDRYLDVTVAADKNEYKPQDKGELTITVKDDQGNPVRAELSLGVVDESIYAIRSDPAGDIKKSFYSPRRWNRVFTQFSVGYNFTGYSTRQAMQLAAHKPPSSLLADIKAEGKVAEAKVRKLFPDTIYWNAHLITDSGGRAKIRVQYPDSLTTWRATVRAVTRDTKVGSVVSKTRTRKNLILRLQAPRFFTERDEITVSTIVHNYLSTEKTARISLQVQGADLPDGTEKSLAIPARGEARIDWRLKANQVGEVNLLGKALTDEESDAVEITLPAAPYGLAVVTGRAGNTTTSEETITEKLTIPANSAERARSLRIDLAPSLASTLVGSLDYLTTYPYGCVEQTMSSFLPNIIVTRTIRELKLNELKSARELPVKVSKGLDRLYRFQHSDGGWGWWETDENNPFMTAYVVAGLSEAKGAGYEVQAPVMQRGRESLTQQLKSAEKKIESDIRSFMIYALVISGGADAALVEELYKGRKELNNLGLALLALTVGRQNKDRIQALADELEKRATVTDREAYWESKRRPMIDFFEDNKLEATAYAVKALSLAKPQSPVTGKAVRWLVNHRRFGYYWDSTKQTAMVIDGLINYLKITRELEPNYRLQVFVNNTLVKEQEVTAADVQNPAGMVLNIDRDPLITGDNNIKIVKSGSGNLYYSLSAKYYTAEDKIAAQGSDQLKIEKSYFKLRAEKQGGKIVYQEEALAGPVTSGDTLLVKLRLTGKNLRHMQYMMIEDPIPAGCEPVEQDELYELGSTAKPRRYWREYDRRELRDQKVVFFKTDFYREPPVEFYYILKAQAPGAYNIMPAQAELMYQPEYRANSENLSIRINEKP